MVYDLNDMNNRLIKLDIPKHNTSDFVVQQNQILSISKYESNQDAILRLCDNILFMSEDSIILNNISVSHDCND